MPTWATACNTSERAGGEGVVDGGNRQIIGSTSPHTQYIILLEESSNPPESPNMRMSAPLFDYGKAVRSEGGQPRALNTVAPQQPTPAATFLDWIAATWENRSHGTRPQPSIPASIRVRRKCERRQPTRSGSRTWFATGPGG